MFDRSSVPSAGPTCLLAGLFVCLHPSAAQADPDRSERGEFYEPTQRQPLVVEHFAPPVAPARASAPASPSGALRVGLGPHGGTHWD